MKYDSNGVRFLTMKEEKHFTLEELSTLTGFPRRTIRYYMQSGLLPGPEGANRGAYYLPDHLDRLLEIRKWQQAGIGLRRIRELLTGTDSLSAVPDKTPVPGEFAVRSHVFLRPGAELVIDPAESGMSPEEVRDMVQRILRAMNETEGEQK